MVMRQASIAGLLRTCTIRVSISFPFGFILYLLPILVVFVIVPLVALRYFFTKKKAP